jgi:hypothetical protein
LRSRHLLLVMGRAQRDFRAGPVPADAGAVVLTVDLVMVRYHLRDRRSARRLMDEAGSFRLGANLYVRLEDLIALEESRKIARLAGTGVTGPCPARRRAPAATRRLRPGWWRDGEMEAQTDR